MNEVARAVAGDEPAAGEGAKQGPIDPEVLAAEIGRYDESIARGKGLFNDDQLRRIAQLRNWRGDRLRTCAFQAILDPKAGPLIAIRLQVMARKSLGGIQTDLACRVLRAEDGEPIPGLYAVGEAAGFGGGGMHGKRSLGGHLPRRLRLHRPPRRRGDRGHGAAAADPPARGRPRAIALAPARFITIGAVPHYDYTTVGHVTVDVLDRRLAPPGRNGVLQRAAGRAAAGCARRS